MTKLCTMTHQVTCLDARVSCCKHLLNANQFCWGHLTSGSKGVGDGIIAVKRLASTTPAPIVLAAAMILKSEVTERSAYVITEKIRKEYRY